jgi:PTS system nitrogen regulatory IIA component
MDLRVGDIARLLEVSEDEVIAWARRRRRTAPGQEVQDRFAPLDVHECAYALGRPVPAAIVAGERGPLPSVARALGRGGIHHGVPGTTPAEVLKAMARLPSIPPQADRERLGTTLVARERLAPTGIGGGIAVPHARDPEVVGVVAPVIVLGFLAHPVDFEAFDGLPVTAVIMLLSPTGPIHLQALAAVMMALQDRELVGLIRAQGSAEAIMARARAREAAPPAPGP